MDILVLVTAKKNFQIIVTGENYLDPVNYFGYLCQKYLDFLSLALLKQPTNIVSLLLGMALKGKKALLFLKNYWYKSYDHFHLVLLVMTTG